MSLFSENGSDEEILIVIFNEKSDESNVLLSLYYNDTVECF